MDRFERKYDFNYSTLDRWSQKYILVELSTTSTGFEQESVVAGKPISPATFAIALTDLPPLERVRAIFADIAYGGLSNGYASTNFLTDGLSQDRDYPWYAKKGIGGVFTKAGALRHGALLAPASVPAEVTALAHGNLNLKSIITGNDTYYFRLGGPTVGTNDWKCAGGFLYLAGLQFRLRIEVI